MEFNKRVINQIVEAIRDGEVEFAISTLAVFAEQAAAIVDMSETEIVEHIARQVEPKVEKYLIWAGDIIMAVEQMNNENQDACVYLDMMCGTPERRVESVAIYNSL